MKQILSILFLLILSLALTSAYAQETTKAKSNLEKEIENKEFVKILNKNLAIFPENTQVSIALIDGDKTTYIGVIRKNDTLQVIDNKNSVFEIGSVTKVFTSVLLSSLITKKQISLQETLQNQFDFTLKNGGEITLQQLANHTSGLPRLPKNIFPLFNVTPNDPYINYTPKLLEYYLKNDVVLENPTGTKSVYSNLGAGLLGYILTKKVKKSYEKLLQEEIFTPLQMRNSSTLLKNIDPQKLIKGLDTNGKETSNWSFTDALVGAGGIKSTIIDMEKFIRKNFEDSTVYNLPQQPTFTINKHLKIGLGWHILSKNNTLWHNGATGGYRSFIGFQKEHKKAIIILSNVSAFHKKSDNIDMVGITFLK